jgi:DNA-binding Lrp family transcriptional regulator
MDDTDRALLAHLRRDGRASLSELAAALGHTRATIRARLGRLLASGTIAGFTALTREDVATSPVRGLTMLGVEGRGAARITARLLGMPAVTAVHSTNGRWDLIAEVGTDTLEGLDRVLADIRQLDGVVTSETSLILSTRRPGRPS